MNWDAEGIVFVDSGWRIVRVSPEGGTPEPLVTVKDEAVYGPQVLPGGQSVLFTVAKGRTEPEWDTAKIVVQSLTTGERKVLIEGVDGSDARYLPTGHLVYAVSGTVWAVPFDLRQQAVSGRGNPVLQGVRRSSTVSQR